MIKFEISKVLLSRNLGFSN